MVRKGCGALLFVSVVLFCAGMAYLTVAVFWMLFAWMTMGKVAPKPVLAFVFNVFFWSVPVAGAIAGIFWGRAILRDDK